MDKKEFRNRVKKIENDETKSMFGIIDVEHICTHSLGSLYYVFPLVERMVVEIFCLVPDVNIEVMNQGTYKSLSEIVLGNNVLETWATDLLLDYYSDHGIRNMIIHNRKGFQVSIDFGKIYELVVYLLEKYVELTLKSDSYTFHPIEELKSNT